MPERSRGKKKEKRKKKKDKTVGFAHPYKLFEKSLTKTSISMYRCQ